MTHPSYIEQIMYGERLKQEQLEKKVERLEAENKELRKENNDLHIMLNVKEQEEYQQFIVEQEQEGW